MGETHTFKSHQFSTFSIYRGSYMRIRYIYSVIVWLISYTIYIYWKFLQHSWLAYMYVRCTYEFMYGQRNETATPAYFCWPFRKRIGTLYNLYRSQHDTGETKPLNYVNIMFGRAWKAIFFSGDSDYNIASCRCRTNVVSQLPMLAFMLGVIRFYVIEIHVLPAWRHTVCLNWDFNWSLQTAKHVKYKR